MISNFKFRGLLKIVFLLFFLSACSEDDELVVENVHLKANVEGENFEVNPNTGSMWGEKRMSTIGTVDLAVKAEGEDGKSIEFFILNYNGKNIYPVGAGFLNDNWIKYSQSTPLGSWGASKSSIPTSGRINSIEITSDNGQKIEGIFTFEGQDTGNSSRKLVTEGDFLLEF